MPLTANGTRELIWCNPIGFNTPATPKKNVKRGASAWLFPKNTFFGFLKQEKKKRNVFWEPINVGKKNDRKTRVHAPQHFLLFDIRSFEILLAGFLFYKILNAFNRIAFCVCQVSREMRANLFFFFILSILLFSHSRNSLLYCLFYIFA